MSKQFEETEYNTLTKNVRFFKRTQKLYNTILDSDYGDEIDTVLNIVHQLFYIIKCLIAAQISNSELEELGKEFFAATFMLMRTITLQVTDKKRKSGPNVGLEPMAKYIQSQVFYDWIEEDEHRRTNVAGYCLLVDANKANVSVQEAFQQVNGYLREFFENDICSLRHHINEELVQAVRKLLEVCMDNTEDEDNREDILLEFGFEKIFQCLCDDLVDGSVQHKRMKKFFKFFE